MVSTALLVFNQLFPRLAFHKAGNISEALRVLNQLTSNAINEKRFNDASYYCWTLSKQCLELLSLVGPKDQARLLRKFEQFQRKADIYYAYHNIHRYIVCFQEKFA